MKTAIDNIKSRRPHLAAIALATFLALLIGAAPGALSHEPGLEPGGAIDAEPQLDDPRAGPRHRLRLRLPRPGDQTSAWASVCCDSTSSFARPAAAARA